MGWPAALFNSLQIAVDVVVDARRGRLDGIAGEMDVRGRRLKLCVAQQFADNRQSLAEGQRARGEGRDRRSPAAGPWPFLLIVRVRAGERKARLCKAGKGETGNGR